MSKKRLLAIAVCAAALVGLGAGSAFAGEVKGPPGSSAPPAEPDYTGARENANSICAYSGQNDFHPPDDVGRTAEHVQSWGQIPQDVRADLRAAGEGPGDACHGGSNHNRDK